MNRKILTGLALVVGIAVVAGAAYLAVNLIASGRAGVNFRAAPPGSGGGLVLMKNGQRITLDLKPAPELPQRAPDVRGQLVEMKDNSLSVNTNATLEGAGGASAISQAGPTTEVVITQDTKIYRDSTFDALQPPPPDGNVQQKVEPYTLAQAAKDGVDTVTAWGTKRGERLVADVVVLGRNVIVRKTTNP
jgi:hypothetical protein